MKPDKCRFRITSIIIAVAMIVSGLSLLSSDFTIRLPQNNQACNIPSRIQTLISPDSSEIATILNETFDGGLSDWFIEKGHPSVVAQITNGELELNSYSTYGFTVYRPVNISKQDYKISFNYRLDDDKNPGNNPWIMQPESGKYVEYGPVVYSVGGWYIRQSSTLPNNSAKVYYDSGTKLYPNFDAQEHITEAFDREVNYQFTIQCWGWNDSVKIQIYNKSSSSYLYQAVGSTFATYTPGNTIMPIPDRIFFGGALTGNCINHCWYDNITITQERGDHTGAIFSSSSAQTVINNMGQEMLTMKYSSSPAKYRLAWDLTNYWSFYSPTYLTANTLTSTRDDVSGEAIEMLSMLYEYAGNPQYLALAEEMWPVLLTHRQSDGGWTFGATTSDYSDTNARIIGGLLALYRVTGDDEYLQHAEVSLANLVNYVNASGVVFGHLTRPSTYTGVLVYFNAHAVVALLNGYKYTGNQTYYDKAVLALSYIMQRITWSGRVTSLAFGNGGSNADYNDVSETGSALYALSEAYKHTGNVTYLQKANLSATYLRNSEFTKNGSAYGVWAGLQFDRLNQSSLLYQWQIYMGLSSYNDINPNTEIGDLLNYSLNSVAGMNSENRTGDPGRIIYEPNGIWGSAWNLNDTDNPGWSKGWWAEGGWGTWGYMTWFGWSGCLLKVLLKQIADADSSTIYLHSTSVVGPSGTWRQLVSSPSISVPLSITSTVNMTVYVSEWATTTRGWQGNATSGTATFTLSGLDNGRMYKIYVDGTRWQTLTASGGSISFTYSGPWSEHQFEVLETSVGGSISGVVNVIFIMLAVGIVVGVTGETVNSFRKKSIPDDEMTRRLLNMVLYIIIGLALLGAAYATVS